MGSFGKMMEKGDGPDDVLQLPSFYAFYAE